MANERDAARPHTGNVTPEDLADPSKHRQQRIFERDDRPSHPPGGTAEPGARAGDIRGAAEPSVGDAFGSDTTGAVAPPAELNRPGASTKLGGTPGAPATGTRGRQAD